MARNIGADRNGDVYRAVITITRTDGTTYTWYEGPYETPGQARARVTFWANRSRATGHIEKTSTTWERV